MPYWQLLIAFTRSNLLGYGGGPSVIPLMKAEVVDTYRWMTADEFGDAVAIGNTLPGPISTKIAAYVGYKVAGPIGAALSVIGAALPTALIMIALAAVLYRYRDADAVKGMIKAVKPVVFVLFLLLAIEFFPYARPDKAGWLPAVLAATSFVALYFFKLHQAVAIFASLIIGALFVR